MVDIDELKREVCKTIDAIAADLLAVSHQLHAEPELAFEEHRSAAVLCDNAERHGLVVERGVYELETAFQSDFGNEGPCVAVISEYDALPGIGHACGHNVIAAIGLGAAIALKGAADRLPGKIRYLGTPAEESGAGKELMIRRGAFDGVDAAMMVHPAGINAKAIRTICISEMHAVFHGKQAHAGAYPEEGVNALDALVGSYQAMSNLRQHIMAGERIHGMFKEAGESPNTVPERTSAHYFVRSANAQALAALKERVTRCFEGAALAAGCTVEITWGEADYLDMVINEPLADSYERNANALGVTDFTDYRELPTGGTDMANVSHLVPSLHPLIKMAPEEVTIHNPDFANWAGSQSGDNAMLDGAKALAMTAIDFIMDEPLREKIIADFTNRDALPAAPIPPAGGKDRHGVLCPC